MKICYSEECTFFNCNPCLRLGKKGGKQEFCYWLQDFEGSKQAKLRSMERAITSQEFNIKVIAVGQGKTLRLGNWTSHIIEALWNNVPVNDQYLLESMRSDLSFFLFLIQILKEF